MPRVPLPVLLLSDGKELPVLEVPLPALLQPDGEELPVLGSPYLLSSSPMEWSCQCPHHLTVFLQPNS